MTDDKPIKSSRIRSFVLRQGKMTAAQRHAMDVLWAHYGLSLDAGRLDFQALFGRDAPVDLEIGFGRGDSLLALTQENPERNYIGVEVHRPGVGALLHRAEKAGIQNLRVFCDDVIDVLEKNIPNESLASVLIFFPDPWHKTKHHKRRLVRPEFVNLLQTKLKPGGILHVATDWEDYAKHVVGVMAPREDFRNMAGDKLFVERPATRPVTKYEQRGQRLGHGVWDMVFEKQ